MLASEVMDAARAHLNDISGQVFNNTILLPYLVTAWETLQSEMQDNSLPTTMEVSSVLAITAGATTISGSSSPALPADFVEPISLHERPVGSTIWSEMTKGSVHPPSSRLYPELFAWDWREDEIKLFGATTDRQVLIRYIKNLPSISGANTDLPVRGCKLYLGYKTAAEAAEDIGQNRTRADRLESKAEMELRKFINIRVKGNQGTPVRRRPYGSRRWRTPLLS